MLSLFIFGVLLAATGANPITIVLIGDSMSEYAGQTVDKYCTNAKSTNKGIGGSTALQVLALKSMTILDYTNSQ